MAPNPLKHDIISAGYTRRIRFRSRNCTDNPFREEDTCSQVFLRSVGCGKWEERSPVEVVGIINLIVFTLAGTSDHAFLAGYFELSAPRHRQVAFDYKQVTFEKESSAQTSLLSYVPYK